jgi:uroporphyrinogen decarboxylase
MTSRERVLTALNHEEPDRVPNFIGTGGAVSLLGPLYEKLKAHWGINAPTRYTSEIFLYSYMDEETMVRLGADGRAVMPGPAPSPLAKRVSDDCIVDGWGITWQRRPGVIYYEPTNAPWANATIDTLDDMVCPDLMHPSRFVGLADRVAEVQRNGYAAVLLSYVTTFEQACLLRGMENLWIDTVDNPEFVEALLSKLSRMNSEYIRELFHHTGPNVDVVLTGDDLGTQSGPMVSPATYRRLIKPSEAQFLQTVHECSKAKVFWHSCGDIYPLVGDLVEIGVDILNPVQVATAGLGDTARLKREFGKQLSFCGAIDTQAVMPLGTTEDVRTEVRRRIKDLAPGGGYLAAAVHCLQPDVPIENVLAMCDEIQKAGQYPLNAVQR